MTIKTEFQNPNVRPHVQVLRAQFMQRQQKNERFSLRAFAYLLELHPSALSRILNGKQEISVKSCLTVFKKLHIVEALREQFIESVVCEKTDTLTCRLKDKEMKDKVS